MTNLYSDVKKLALQHGVSFSKIASFIWHLHRKGN